ncbi:hypothetical protein [Futiania mangrovi]|nr:hypothetical protein [Futiania mangrovii]
MKAFLIGIGLAIVVGVGAWYALEQMPWDSATATSSENVRL